MYHIDILLICKVENDETYREKNRYFLYKKSKEVGAFMDLRSEIKTKTPAAKAIGVSSRLFSFYFQDKFRLR